MTSTPDATKGLLDGRHYAVLATHNNGGSIHLTPVWYLFENGMFFVESLASDRKARNADARPDATIIVDVRQPGSECWVYASGPVDLLQGDESREINERIVARYLTDEALADPRIGQAFTTGMDATMRLVPAVWRSWSLRDIDDQFFGGILGSTPDMWFLPIAA